MHEDDEYIWEDGKSYKEEWKDEKANCKEWSKIKIAHL